MTSALVPSIPDFSALVPGQEITTVVVLARKEEKTTRAGNKPYLRLELANELGQRISSKIWSESLGTWATIPCGTPLEVRGRVEPGYPPGQGAPALQGLSLTRIAAPPR